MGYMLSFTVNKGTFRKSLNLFGPPVPQIGKIILFQYEDRGMDQLVFIDFFLGFKILLTK